MSLYKNAAQFDALRSVTPAAIGATYTACGNPLPSPAVLLSFKNQTNGDVVISTDGVTDMLYIPSNSFNIFDVRTNSPTYNDLMFKEGTVFYVKDGSTVGTTGNFYIEVVLAVRM